ncbi:MAG: hypothetical protein A2806_00595 [Candidatus Terrybacteria bacterium RIFCSPHIGHO2_01_FULL_48_17]|uniref:SUF system FeS cluster assembly SufBD core domain-containing protein n=1 Tax=Candidatus Terrybacteria bacterium RIFCSPHIGHO2_01_FULL_48_17 TaxID=1802362 RepID=A0A1G2PIN1_9BACT|nr:MAG: hypothetical protein A2806_00595 [Candidatus Terrybacteria bacterium RIFCSPHIGHO2_01_FULL_48_17]OHA53841.1 MAG: hypothetical protein A3A30_01190 [Candidatus Terrybacteria bacterium RIFCSPLOWO2_01_FULL_48_14]
MEIVIRRPQTQKLKYQWRGRKAHNIIIRLVAAKAGVELSGTFIAKKNDSLPISISIHHEAPETKSRIFVRGIAQDRSVVSFRANARLKKGARKADAAINAKALLLSQNARCELQPDLEIDEQEVRATHTTFVGPLDEEEIFYLQSRGVSEEKAKELLIKGFLNIAQHVKQVK